VPRWFVLNWPPAGLYFFFYSPCPHPRLHPKTIWLHNSPSGQLFSVAPGWTFRAGRTLDSIAPPSGKRPSSLVTARLFPPRAPIAGVLTPCQPSDLPYVLALRTPQPKGEFMALRSSIAPPSSSRCFSPCCVAQSCLVPPCTD